MTEIKRNRASVFALVVAVVLFTGIAQAAFQRPAYMGNPTPTSMTVNWKTDAGATSVVKFGTAVSYGMQATGPDGFKTLDNSPGTLHSVVITGLAPGTKYFYQILTDGSPLTTAGDSTYFFKTAPQTDSTAPFTFAILGDSDGDTGVATQFARLQPDFVLTDGDIVYPYGGSVSATTEGRQDPRYYDIYSATMKNTPYYATCGNHDYHPNGCQDPDVLDQENPLPGNGQMGGGNTTYSFDYGNVHFVALNSNLSVTYDAANPANSAAQIAWAWNDLKNSTKPWKIVYWHHNGWSAGTHSSDSTILDNLVSMCEDAKVNVCFWGHSHVYERFPVERGTAAYTIGNGGQKGSTSCSSGTGGTTKHPGATCLGHSNGESGLLFVQINGNSSTWDYYTSAGAKTDSATYTVSGAPVDTTSPSAPVNLRKR